MGTAYNTNIVTDGLRGCWDAGNRRSYPTTGTVLTDLAGGVNGTLTNEDDDALNFNSFKGGYLQFDGTDGRVDCGDNLMVGWSEISVCVWALVENDGDDFPRLVTRGGSCFELAISRTTQHFLFCYVNGSYINTPTDSMNDHYGKWTHYAARWVTGTGDWRLYINGELIVASQKYDSTLGSDHNLSFADRPAGGRALDGAMGPVYIYDRALSDDEIKQNYEATKSRFVPRITKSGLVGNWDAGDPASYPGGTTLKDTANGTTATFSNMDGSNFNSANGGYWEFDGTNEYIQCSTNSVLQPQSFSVEAWVKDDQTEHYLPIVAWADANYPAVWTSYHASDQSPIIYMNSADYRYFNNTATSVAGWHHVVFTYTYDDMTTGAFYVDGVSIATFGSTSDGTKASTNTCRIGRAGSYYYTGDMGLVRIYDRPLSAAEILDNYNKTKARFGH